MTSYYSYGRGLSVDLHPPDSALDLGAYYLKGRWRASNREQFGVYLDRQLTDSLAARVNLLRHDYDAIGDRPAGEDTIWSVEGRFQPSDRMKLTAEYARSRSDRDGGVSDDAYRVNVDGLLGRNNYYSLNKTHAGPNYYGYYRAV